MSPDPFAAQLLPDRACGPCVSCCCFYAIAELDKPAGRLCRHSLTGGGCAVYAERPKACRVFFCAWRCWDAVPPEWRPDRTGFILGGRLLPGRILSVTADPARPDGWRHPDYYRQLQQWAGQAAAIGSHVVVFVADRVIVLQPERELDLGVVGADEVLLAEAGEIVKIPRSDPRAG